MILDDKAIRSLLDPADRANWDTMDEDSREATRRRLSAIREWERAPDKFSASEAAAFAGVGLSRFYKMASLWRENGRLDGLGTIKAVRGKRASKLDAVAVNALQAVAAKVVARNDGASVSSLVSLMVTESGVEDFDPPRRLPSKMKLREIIETELRRKEALHDAGHMVAFDCSALTWAVSPELPHCLFLLIDRGTRTILGHHVGTFDEGLAGYARAAQRAADQIGKIELPWARDLLSIQFVAGPDSERFFKLAEMMERDFRISVQIASRKDRFGRYLKDTVGERLGPVVFAPKATRIGSALDFEGVAGAQLPKVNGAIDVRESAWVKVTVDLAVQEFNDTEVIPHLKKRPDPASNRPAPTRLREALEFVARQGA